MTFNDIFKSSFLENMASVSLVDMGLALLLSFLVGMFIYLVYERTFQGVMYSSSFGVTLVALTMITTLVILAVTSNVVVRCDGASSEQAVRSLLGKQCKKVVVKSKTARAGSVELDVEVRLQNDDTSFVNELTALPGVTDTALVSYNGDYLG